MRYICNLKTVSCISLAVLMLFVTSVSLNAQNKNSLIFGNAKVKYKRMETTGTILTAVGGVTLLTGNILYWKTYNHPTAEGPNLNNAKTYSTMMAGGFGLMAVGVPLLTIGKINQRRIEIEAGLVRYKGLASANGVGVKIRF